jgi:hypothetical protein
MLHQPSLTSFCAAVSMQDRLGKAAVPCSEPNIMFPVAWEGLQEITHNQKMLPIYHMATVAISSKYGLLP